MSRNESEASLDMSLFQTEDEEEDDGGEHNECDGRLGPMTK